MTASRMCAAWQFVLVALAAAYAAGCVNLPPALERELACPAAGEPDNFGAHDSCTSFAPQPSR